MLSVGQGRPYPELHDLARCHQRRASESAAESAGLCPGDEIVAIDGEVPTDVIRWQLLVDEADPVLAVQRGGLELDVQSR